MIEIRPATPADVPEILAIYNEVIAHSTAIYTETPVTLADRMAWFEARRQQGFPVLAAEEAGSVLGFASFGDFRAWPCYRYSVEHSVHIRDDARGRGIGSLLIEALLVEARRLGKHIMIAGVDGANQASLRFHERLGFEKVGHFREVGFKFDRWLDLVFLQKTLEPAAAP